MTFIPFLYHWDGEFAEEFEILKDRQIRFGHARVEHGSFQFFLDGRIHVAQHHHVHEWFLWRLVLDVEFVLGVQLSGPPSSHPTIKWRTFIPSV